MGATKKGSGARPDCQHYRMDAANALNLNILFIFQA
jgi:hypothetical protein